MKQSKKKTTPIKYRARPSRKNSKNVSKKIENGRTLQTRDEFLEGGKDKIIHPEHPDPNDLYRKIVVIDSNRNDEIVAVKTGKSNGKPLVDYQLGESKYKPFVVTSDADGRPIVVDGKKFKKNKRNENVSKKDVNTIKKDCLTSPETSKRLRKENRKKIRKLKNR